MTTATLTVETIDPATLLVDANIRVATSLGKDFLASVRDYGVLVPIVAVRTAEGALRVRYGHRRTLAAIETGQPSVPVVITGEDDADDIARIVTQWQENEQRAGLSVTDKASAAEQLALLGLSPAQIVKRTKARKAEVEQALAVSGSDLAKAAAGRYEFLTLDQAAGVAEFDDDPETVKALVAAAKDGEGSFAHVLQRARDDRAEAAQIAQLTAQLTNDGVRVVEPVGYSDRATKRLEELVTDKGKPIKPAAHASCPGHAAFVTRTWRDVEAVYVCTQWAEAGHRDRYSSSTGRSSTGTGGPMTEHAKTERREVIANNKEWRSAETVRRRFGTGLLARKTPPNGAAAYVATELASPRSELRYLLGRTDRLAVSLLGADDSKGAGDQTIATQAATASDGRAQVITLAFVLAAVEASTSEHTWREPREVHRRYFTFLAANGYTLAEVEQRVIAPPKQARRAKTTTAHPAEPTVADPGEPRSEAASAEQPSTGAEVAP